MIARTLHAPAHGWHFAGRAGLWVFLIAAALFFAIPLLIMISTSLKTAEEVRAGSVFLPPVDPTMAAYAKAWGTACNGMYRAHLRGAVGGPLEFGAHPCAVKHCFRWQSPRSKAKRFRFGGRPMPG